MRRYGSRPTFKFPGIYLMGLTALLGWLGIA